MLALGKLSSAGIAVCSKPADLKHLKGRGYRDQDNILMLLHLVGYGDQDNILMLLHLVGYGDQDNILMLLHLVGYGDQDNILMLLQGQ